MKPQTTNNLKHKSLEFIPQKCGKGIVGVLSTLVENYKPDTPPFLVIL